MLCLRADLVFSLSPSRILWATALTTVQTVPTMLSTIISSRTIRKLVCPLSFPLSTSLSCRLAMFFIGSNVATWPLQAQRGLADGHEICVREYLFFPRCTAPSHFHRHLVSPLQSVLFSLPSSLLTLRAVTSLTNQEVFAEFYYSTSCRPRLAPRSSLGSCMRVPLPFDSSFIPLQMEIIKLVLGVTCTCWRVRSLFLTTH